MVILAYIMCQEEIDFMPPCLPMSHSTVIKACIEFNPQTPKDKVCFHFWQCKHPNNIMFSNNVLMYFTCCVIFTFQNVQNNILRIVSIRAAVQRHCAKNSELYGFLFVLFLKPSNCREIFSPLENISEPWRICHNNNCNETLSSITAWDLSPTIFQQPGGEGKANQQP